MPSVKQHIYLFLFGCFILLLSGCELSDKDDSFEESFIYGFQKDQQIVVDTTERQVTEDSTQTFLNVSTKPGNHLVFQFKKIVTTPPQIADGGSTRTIYFQIPSDINEFDFKDDDLKQAKVYFRRSCFCPFLGALEVDKGFIRGQKLSANIWTISGSIQTESSSESFDLEFDGTFILNQEE